MATFFVCTTNFVLLVNKRKKRVHAAKSDVAAVVRFGIFIVVGLMKMTLFDAIYLAFIAMENRLQMCV